MNTNNTAPCDDRDECTTGDICSAGTCAGTPRPHDEVDGLRLGPDKSLLAWSGGADVPLDTVYQVPRGILREFPVGTGARETCVASGIAEVTTTDPTNPDAGSGYWYLVRARDGCGIGTYGFAAVRGTPSAERVTTVCP